MSNKALILSMYFVALFIILRNYYRQPGAKGMPYPTVITAPSYLYAVLGLTADFTGGLSTVLAVGLTLGLYYRVHTGASNPAPPSSAAGSGGAGKSGLRKRTTPYTVPAKKVGAN